MSRRAMSPLSWLDRIIESCSTMAVWSALIVSLGCARGPHFTVSDAPAPADRLPPIVSGSAQVEATLGIIDSVVVDDTELPQDERPLLRQTLALQLANSLYDAIGREGVVRTVTRQEDDRSNGADFLLHGTYRFFGRLGTGSLGRIPVYGLYARLNKAWTRERVQLRITDARSGAELWRHDFEDEHRQTRRAIQRDKPWVPFLAPAFIESMGRAVCEEMRSLGASRPRTRPKP